MVFLVRERVQLLTTDEKVAPVEYNYQEKATLERKGQTYHLSGEQPGVSIFLRDDEDRIFHTYSAYARGLDILGGTYNWRHPSAARRNGKTHPPADRKAQHMDGSAITTNTTNPRARQFPAALRTRRLSLSHPRQPLESTFPDQASAASRAFRRKFRGTANQGDVMRAASPRRRRWSAPRMYRSEESLARRIGGRLQFALQSIGQGTVDLEGTGTIAADFVQVHQPATSGFAHGSTSKTASIHRTALA